jgi:hypothetical protein
MNGPSGPGGARCRPKQGHHSTTQPKKQGFCANSSPNTARRTEKKGACGPPSPIRRRFYAIGCANCSESGARSNPDGDTGSGMFTMAPPFTGAEQGWTGVQYAGGPPPDQAAPVDGAEVLPCRIEDGLLLRGGPIRAQLAEPLEGESIVPGTDTVGLAPNAGAERWRQGRRPRVGGIQPSAPDPAARPYSRRSTRATQTRPGHGDHLCLASGRIVSRPDWFWDR